MAQCLWSQGGFGVMAGRILDPSGAVIVGAKVAAVNTGTNLRAEATTNESGYYQIGQLIPGTYRIEAEAAGFKRATRPDVTVQVNDRLTIDLPLEIGSADASVLVTAEIPALRTQDAQTGEVITGTMVRNLPQLNRDPTQLLTLSGNVQGSGGRAASGSDTRINGGRTVGVEYIVDGMTAGTGMAHGVANTTPTMETVAEFKVITNGISAEYGRLSGGAVEIVTKGGGNTFHGESFEYFQNDHLNANSWSQNALGGKKVKFSQNIFGGVASGPVVLPKVYNGRNRTFFTGNYEGTRLRQAGSLQTLSVPTAAERAGDLSGFVYNGLTPTLYDQDGNVNYDAATNTYTRTTLIGDGLRIPASRIHPVAAAALKFIPLPNQPSRPGYSSQGNYVAPQNFRSNLDRWGFRLDHQLTSANRVFARYMRYGYDSGRTRLYEASTASQTEIKGVFGVTVSDVWSVTPTTVLETRAGVNHNPYSSGNLLPSNFDTSSVPFDPITRSLIGNNMPDITLGTYQLGYAQSRSTTNSTTYDLAATVTKVVKNHTIKVGAQHRRYLDNFRTSSSGTFRFDGAGVHQTAGVDFGYGSNIGNAYALGAYLLGIMDRNVVTGETTRANAFNYYAGFVQDDYRVTPKLTLNVGLRWDMESPITERHDKLYLWDPDAPPPFTMTAGYDFAAAVRASGLDPAAVQTPTWATQGFAKGAVRIANTPEYRSRLATEYHPWNFAPRFGMAYQLTSKTVMRGSFGLMYISTSGASGAYSTGGSSISLAAAADAGWHSSLDNMVHILSTFTSPFLPNQYSPYIRTNAQANLQATGASGPSAFNKYSHMPQEYTWSFGLQRELPRGFTTEVTYSANAGRGLLGPDIIGRFPSNLFNGGAAGQNARIYTTTAASPTAGQTMTNAVVGPTQNLGILEMAYPYYGAMAVLGSNIGTSNYHSVNFRIEKRLSAGVSFLANYTISKSLDDVGGADVGVGAGVAGINTGAKRAQTVDNTTAVYGLSPLDETHVVRGTYNIELPFGQGRRFLGHPTSFAAGVLDKVVGGWQLAGTGTYRSGRPVVLTASTPNINNAVRVEWTYGSFVPGATTVVDPRFQDASQVFYSSRDARPSNLIRAFANVTDAQKFVYGNLPPIIGTFRHPSNMNYDLSLMKAFYFSAERSRYLQFRMEGNNIFNIRGFGSYNTTIGSSDFGLITGAGNVERKIQASARIVF